MQSSVKTIPGWGRVLWMTDGKTEVGAALDFGIRIVHLSCAGRENVFYRQPEDCSDGLCTGRGWRVRGGHRLWAAPESEQSYYPDNDPVAWRQEADGAVLTQETDPWLGVRKSLRLSFQPDGSVLLEHAVQNVSDRPVRAASWGVNTLAGGGTAEVDFAGPAAADYAPRRVVSLWGDTSLHDPRLRFSRDRLEARHLPLDDYCKIGLYSAQGRAVFCGRGQRLELTFAAEPLECYPDNGCNFELYLDRHVMELETLGVLRTLEPGQRAEHAERWRIVEA